MHERRRTIVLMLVMCALAMAPSCASGPPAAAALDPRADACAYCRMLVSDPRFASQVVAPGEDAKFFDDLACLRSYLQRGPLPSGARIFVADHRTGAWVDADAAVYATLGSANGPMGSRVVAHESAASRSQDTDAVSAVGIAKKEAIGR